MRLKGKTALISGAGRNNGKAIALTFAREGADLILIAKQRREELDQVARECESMGVKTLPVLADVSKPEEVDRVVKMGLAHFGKVDVLMSVVGIRPHKLPWEFSIEEWKHVFDVNLHPTFYLSKALVPGMIERKSGSIIALGGSSVVTATSRYGAAVVASKYGLHGLIKSLAQALGPYNVRANLLAPGNIENERRNPEWYQNTGEVGDPNTSSAQRGKLSPLGRQGKPQEVANVALFLASDESSYVTGDRICCYGGMHM